MSLIDQSHAIFYHPLDSLQEYTKSQDWAGNIDFVPAKVVSGATPLNSLTEFVINPSGNLLDGTFNDLSALDRVAIVKLDENNGLLHMGEYTVLFDVIGSVVATGTKLTTQTRPEFTSADRVAYSGGESGLVLLTSWKSNTTIKTQMRLLSVSGLTLTSIQSEQFDGTVNNYDNIGMDVFDDGAHALVISSNNQRSMIVSISGGGFSSGVTQLLAPISLPCHDIATINTSGAVAIFQDGDAYVVNCDFATDTITFGSGHSFSSNIGTINVSSHENNGKVLHIGDNRILIVYRNLDAGHAKVGEVSGTTITFGDEIDISKGSSPTDASWVTRHMEISEISSGTFMCSYEHRLKGQTAPEDINFLKYRILTVDGITVTATDDRSWINTNSPGVENNVNASMITAMSPSSVVGGYRDSLSSSLRDIFFHVGVPLQEIDFSISGASYPSVSGLDHIATAMWVKDPFPTSGSEEIITEFGYHQRIQPSAILLGDDTTFNFVGSLSHGFETGLDSNHEGHDGEDSDFILTNVSGFLNANNADIVLLHIGTNDIAVAANISGIRDNISGICETIWGWGVASGIDTRIILAQITNWSGVTTSFGLDTTALNDLLQTLGDDFAIAGNKITVVDMENALIYPDDIVDNVHPTASGFDKMAAVWFPPLISGIKDVRQLTGRVEVNVMPLGDSITNGFIILNGYRFTLQNLLLSSGLVGVSWTGTDIDTVISGINDSSDHFLMTDLSSSGGLWTLKTSVDCADWVDQGNPDTGIQGLVNSSGYTPKIFMTDGSDTQWLDEVAVWGGNFEEFTSGELSNLYDLGEVFTLPLSAYTSQYQTVSGNIDMYISGFIPSINDNSTLYVAGPVPVNDNINLFIESTIPVSGDFNMYVSGVGALNDDIGLFIEGSGIAASGAMARVFDSFVIAGDYSPQIIGRFATTPTTVTIQVWDVIDGANTVVSLTDNTCNRIGNTDSWRWSTANLPTFAGTNRQFFYVMTSDLTELFEGQFLLDVKESARWFHPRDIDLYIR